MSADGFIDVLVAEDSAVTRMFLVHLLGAEPRIRVVAAVADGQAAVDYVLSHAVDVVLMDIHMPRLDGFAATRRIMEMRPLPIVICSATAKMDDVRTTFRALEAGAVACIEKPVGIGHPDYEAIAGNLVQTVRAMAEVRVVRRSNRLRTPVAVPAAAAPGAMPGSPLRLIGIGASTGGPPVLQAILSALPGDFAIPVLIVQHITSGFLPGMVGWLNEATPLQVQIAAHGVRPQPGSVYLAPDDAHLGVGEEGTLVLSHDPPENHVRPAVSYLFRSLAERTGGACAAVLLTGMGRDGADELKLLRERGAVTIAQDRESSIVHGMPGVAIALGAAMHVLPPAGIGPLLASLVRQRDTLHGRGPDG